MRNRSSNPHAEPVSGLRWSEFDWRGPGIVTAEESDSLDDVLKRMRSFGIRRIPIVNDAGGLEGLISFDDLLEFVQEQLADLATLLNREENTRSTPDRTWNDSGWYPGRHRGETGEPPRSKN